MKKRVLHVLTSNKYSGAENVACMIINNTNVDAYYCSPKGPIESILKEKSIKFISLNKFNVSYLKKIIKEYNINIVHAHDFKASFLASFLPKEIKVISHLHCNYKLLKLKGIISFMYSIVQKRFNKIIVVSKEILDDAPFGKKIRKKTKVLNNVVDPRRVKELSEEEKVSKYELIFVGRLIDVKQPQLFIEIVESLKKEFPNIKACMIGDGVLYNKCQEEIKEKKLEKNIDLVGFKSNPFPYIKNSKISVLTSKFEGLPMSVIECLILDVPVVNSGVGGLSIMFNEHKKYICKNKKEFIPCISKLLKQDPKEYKEDCKKIRAKYTDIKKYSKEIEKIYDEK